MAASFPARTVACYEEPPHLQRDRAIRRAEETWQGLGTLGPRSAACCTLALQPSQDALGKKPYTDICPALVKILKHLLSLGSLTLQPDLVRLPRES